MPTPHCLPGLFAAGEVPVARGQVMLMAGDQRNWQEDTSIQLLTEFGGSNYLQYQALVSHPSAV
ncbi:hypothetical protein EK904_013496 [Melospiza melodia maxima]|nr:hypothetical protein EK904_013496 [Melospiza melodia maxima]